MLLKLKQLDSLILLQLKLRTI